MPFLTESGGEGEGELDTGTLEMRYEDECLWAPTQYFHNAAVRLLEMLADEAKITSSIILGLNFLVACPFYLKRCACCARGPGYLRLGDWYSWDSRAWLVFWLGLLANFTVMGSVAPGGFWQFRPLMASSASTRRSKRMKPTPLETPVESCWPFPQSSPHEQLWQ